MFIRHRLKVVFLEQGGLSKRPIRAKPLFLISLFSLLLFVETISLLKAIYDFDMLSLQRKVKSKVWRWYYLTFYGQRKLLVGLKDVVKASEGSTERSPC